MIHIYQRQNRHGDWWVNGTIQGYDHYFESPILDKAVAQMKDLLHRMGVAEGDVVWHEPTLYLKQGKKPDPPITYQISRIDTGMV